MSTENKPVNIVEIKRAGGVLKGNGFSIALHTDGLAGKIHIHDCYELELLVEGSVNIRLNGRQIEEKKGAFWLSLPNNLHHITKASEDAQIVSIKFEDSFLSNKVYNMLGMYPNGIMGTLPERELNICMDMIDRILDTYISVNSELCKNVFIKNAIEAMLVVFVDKCDDSATDTTEEMAEHNIFEAVSYVKKHFTEELTANDMAKRLGYTPNYFSMKFKSLTGKNFIETVNDERLQLAYYMLSTMDISVRDVSEYVGYSSIAYFSRMFKKKYKMSPRDVKKLER